MIEFASLMITDLLVFLGCGLLLAFGLILAAVKTGFLRD
jgi:hypothetical protein